MTQSFSDNEDMSFLKDNLQRVKENIAEALIKSGRAENDARLMAVTKTVKPGYINYMLDAGVDLIGENKVQELLSKLEFLRAPLPEMHIIGHLQSNKVRKIINVVSMIQSVDSVSLASEISRQAELHSVTADVLLEVNIGDEESKTGLPQELLREAAAEISQMKGICIKGLMCVPPICESDAEARRYFEKTRRLFEDLKGSLEDKNSFSVLSMGMSGDYVPAILEGATLVRVGSALFGRRVY